MAAPCTQTHARSTAMSLGYTVYVMPYSFYSFLHTTHTIKRIETT